MGWNDYPLDSITIPASAAPTDPYVYIGQDDDLLTSLAQDAGIVWHYDDTAGFFISVEQDGFPDPTTYGQWNFFALDDDPGGQLFQFMSAYVDRDNAEAGITLGDPGGDLRSCSTSITGTDVAIHASGDIADGGGIVQLGFAGTAFPPDDTDVQIYGRSLGRGLRARVSEPTSYFGIDTTETVVLTLPSRTYVHNRAYRIETYGGVQQTQAAITDASCQVAFRKTDASGQILGGLRRTSLPAQNNAYSVTGHVDFRVGSTDVTAVLVMTMWAGGVGQIVDHLAATVRPRVLKVYDVGSYDEYDGAPELV